MNHVQQGSSRLINRHEIRARLKNVQFGFHVIPCPPRLKAALVISHEIWQPYLRWRFYYFFFSSCKNAKDDFVGMWFADERQYKLEAKFVT